MPLALSASLHHLASTLDSSTTMYVPIIVLAEDVTGWVVGLRLLYGDSPLFSRLVQSGSHKISFHQALNYAQGAIGPRDNPVLHFFYTWLQGHWLDKLYPILSIAWHVGWYTSTLFHSELWYVHPKFMTH